uniref:Pentapeptide repeat protein n=1 Tax=Cyanothece sp. (strain PCC 7425 / ATCC 29141) TaxID=395961 RepID=B8HLY5_CYAP4
MTWYERQQRRKSSPFLRLLDRSFSFRLMLAALLAFVLLAAVNRFQNCHASKFSEDCLETNFWAIVSISNVESFSIVTAALLYILENKQRQQEQHREALDIVMTSQAAGAVLSFGRIRALETLNQAGLWLDGINLQGANLEQLEAPYGRWRGVNLSYTTLMKANFYQTDLSGANLTDANLTEANLNGADLTDADLTRANLTNADLRSANLTRTKLADANLTRTKLDPVLAYSHE